MNSLAPGQHWEKTGDLFIHAADYSGRRNVGIGNWYNDLAEDLHDWLSRDDDDSASAKGFEHAKRINVRVTVEILDVEFYNG